jgi:hypothetical protein
MDGREQAIQYFTQKKRELTEKRAKLLRPIVEVDKEILTVTDALAMMLRDGSFVPSETEGFPLRKIKNMTQTQALIEIAKYNGGTLRSLEAKPILIAAKLMKNSKNAAGMVNGAISRSEAFIRVKRGEYRLKDALNLAGDESTMADMSDYAKRAGLRTVEKPVQ